MIIDCHTHLNRYAESDPERLTERYRLLKSEMARHGVGYALVLTSYDVTAAWPALHEVVELVEDDPQIGVIAGVSHLHDPVQHLAELRELLGTGRVRGLKLYPGYEPFYVHDPRLRVVYELAGEFRAPVMIHTGDTFDSRGKVKYSHPLAVDEVAVDFREVTFVICHLGNPWLTDAMEVIYKNENVVGDLSGLTLGAFEERFESYMLRRVQEVLTFVGDASSLLYGTDWPICDMGSYIRFVEKLRLPPEQAEQIFWRNAARVFGIEVEPGAAGAGG